MIKIKNLRAGTVFITDAGLKLIPGQVASVENISPQTRMLIEKGYVARIGDNPDSPVSGSSVTDNRNIENRTTENGETTVPKEYGDWHAPEAIKYIEGVTDIQILEAILKEERRKTVLEAIEEQLKKLE